MRPFQCPILVAVHALRRPVHPAETIVPRRPRALEPAPALPHFSFMMHAFAIPLSHLPKRFRTLLFFAAATSGMATPVRASKRDRPGRFRELQMAARK
mmetsp:Transcript_150189/g.418451  ORF Transcript_150189/g.418451 Transcript_150189/m.418451 type:complete len:98 (+) Transcript_150189:191-484(+)